MPESHRHLVLVCGDVIRDHHTYMGDRTTHDSRASLGSTYWPRLGGARLLFRMIESASAIPTESELVARTKLNELKILAEDLSKSEKAGRPDLGRELEVVQARIKDELAARARLANAYDVVFSGEIKPEVALPSHLHGYAIWKPYPVAADGSSDERVWRVETPLGYGARLDDDPKFPQMDHVQSRPDCVVIDDAGLGFRSAPFQDWPNALHGDVKARFIVLKMARPLAHGPLWNFLIKPENKSRLVVIVSIDDIRRDAVRVSKGISWERSALDLVDELHDNAAILPLLESRHLIINFRSEGALHVRRDGDKYVHRLVFDPGNLEEEWLGGRQGTVFGYTSCLTAAIVHRLATGKEDALEGGIAAGLNAMRVLFEHGHGPVGRAEPSYDFEALARAINKDQVTPFAAVTVPHPEQRDPYWTILSATERELGRGDRPLLGIATGIALAGETALGRVPHLEFGKLKTVDRNEIESLRSIQELVVNYREHDKGDKPLCLAVFGPPGSGKSFGVKQIAKTIGGKNARILEFNVSQFESYGDLIGAFHQVRDAALGPEVPFVFWDEFDAKEYKWLQYLLAPMQDGAFHEGTSTHPIGKCIFIFAGGTSEEMAKFGPEKPPKNAGTEHKETVDAYNKFRLLKGPDFVSRIAGSLDVLGPNEKKWAAAAKKKTEAEQPAERPPDVCYPIRRALFLRQTLGLKRRERLDIDRGLLAALLGTKEYTHGARSLERLLLEIRARSAGQLTRSALPPPEVLSLFVDTADFYAKLVRAQVDFNIDKVAEKLHANYLSKNAGKVPGGEFDKSYGLLEEPEKNENRAAARRIPLVLELAGLYVAEDPGREGTPKNVDDVLNHYLETLAEAEHELWVEHKRRGGWTRGERNRDALTHPDLVPYDRLTEASRQRDRDQVKAFPVVLEAADYRIVSDADGKLRSESRTSRSRGVRS